MQSEKICPRCGRSSREVPFIGNLCKDCFIEVNGIARIPEKIDFIYCQYCGRFKYQGGWNEPSGSTLEETLVDYIMMVLSKKLKPTPGINEAWIDKVELLRPFHGAGLYKILVLIKGRSNNIELAEERIITVKADAGVCPLCTNRITKRGYEAILQVRSSSGKLSSELRERVDDFLMHELASTLKESIISVEEHKEGFDILLADPTSARIIASKLRTAFMAKTIETYKLIGRKPSGARKGRLTISVRIPDIAPGDVLKIDGKLYLYLATAKRGSPVLLDLANGKEFTVRSDYLWRRGFETYQGGMESKILMLLSVSGGSVLFADSSSGFSEMIDFPRERVRVFVDKFVPGKLYKVLIVSDRAYVLEHVDEG